MGKHKLRSKVAMELLISPLVDRHAAQRIMAIVKEWS
jgi:hypothetical protein